MLIELEVIMLSEIRQAPKDNYHRLSLMWNIKLLILKKLRVEWWLPNTEESKGERKLGKGWLNE
jgi:hypothetical protein